MNFETLEIDEFDQHLTKPKKNNTILQEITLEKRSNMTDLMNIKYFE